jgi:iron complex outermembrane receptor protein
MKQIHLAFTAMTLFVLTFFNGMSQNKEKQDTSMTGRVFRLGEITVTAMQDKAVIKAEENEQFNRMDIAHSLNIMPSLALSNFGARNESTIYLRGFDLRQIPVYIDGIPVYVPYDGYIDMGFFSTFDLSEIDVSKGFSSMLYGPNTLGGSINLITMKPKNKLELTAIAGIMSGEGFKGVINAGSNLGKFYFLGSFSKIQSKYFPLSHHFDTVRTENGGARDNSFRNDIKANIKVGFTPNAHDEYSINYIYQHGSKGTPVYTGSDPTIRLRYWQWPYWDKESIYFISRTMISKKSYVKTRIYYDRFKNQLNSYDDATYTTRTRPYAFQSFYNDETRGASIETGTESIPLNNLKFAILFKNDQHREHNLNEPVRHFQDNTYSFSLEDNFEINKELSLITGLSYNLRQSVKAEDYNSSAGTITDFPSNHNDALNAQIGVYYSLSANHRLSGSIARKTRFATMKDRYSYKMGTAIPNIDLKAEKATNYEIAYAGTLLEKITVRPAIFYNRINDAIQMVDNVLPGISQMQNTGTADFFGGEFTETCNVTKKLTTSINYTYIVRRNLTNPDIKFTDVPEHKIFASVLYKPVDRIEVSLSGEYDSKRYSTSYGNIAPGFAVFNTRIAGRVWKYLFIELGMNNIFDRNYYLSEGYPEEGRNYYGSLIFKFN